MIQVAGQVVPLKIDIDRKEVAPLVAKYKVSSIPAVFVMDANGKVVGTVEITMTPSNFASQVTGILKKQKATGKR